MTSTHSRWIRAALALTAAVSALAFNAPTAFAQAYPNRPITLVIPFPPGAGSDLVLRPLAEHISKTLGQNVLVDNKPGGGSIIASKYVKQQPADGYTIYHVSNTALTKSMVPDAEVDIRKDFTPIIMPLYSPLIITVNSDQMKATTVKEMIAEIRTKPGQLNYGSYGIGSGGHLFMEILLNEGKAKMVHVPFQGTAQAVTATVAGEVQVTTSILASLRAHIKETSGSGKLRVIAVTTGDRSGVLPNTPGMKEAGYPDIDYSIWSGIVGPAGLPRDVVAKLNQALNTAVKDPKIIETELRFGQFTKGGTPEVLVDQINREFNAYAKLIKETGLKLE